MAQSDAVVELHPPVKHALFILRKHGCLRSPLVVYGNIDLLTIRYRDSVSRLKAVVDALATKAYNVVRINEVGKFRLGTEIDDACIPVKGVFLRVVTEVDRVVVIGIVKRQVTEQLIRKQVVPAERGGGVAPAETGGVARGEVVAAEIAGEEHLVAVAEFVIGL